jgi:hypothetical protein
MKLDVVLVSASITVTRDKFMNKLLRDYSYSIASLLYDSKADWLVGIFSGVP